MASPAPRLAVALLAPLAPITALTDPAAALPRPLADSFLAVEGRPVILPVTLAPADDPSAVVGVVAATGAVFEGRLVRIVPDQQVAAGAWLPSPPALRVAPPLPAANPGATPEPGESQWLLVVDGVPMGTAAVSIGPATVAVRWLEDPWRAAARAGLAPADFRDDAEATVNPWASPVPEAWRHEQTLIEALRGPAADVESAWRVRLALAGLVPVDPAAPPLQRAVSLDVLAGVAEPESRDALDDIADLVTARWQSALLRAWSIDPVLAADLRRALAGAARLPDADADDRVVPMWTLDAAVAAEILALLSEPGDDRGIAERLSAQLDALPAAAAWVIDHAGPEAAPPTLGVVNLAGRSGLAACTGGSGRAVGQEALPLGPGESGLIQPVLASRGPATSEPLRVTLSLWSGVREVAVRPVPVRPPGLGMGPLFDDLTMPAFLGIAAAEEPVALPPTVTTVARLERRAPPDGRGGAAGPEAWCLTIECLAPEPIPGDEVVIYLGPVAAPTGVLSVRRDGVITPLHHANDAARWTPVPQESSRWVVVVPLPASALTDPKALQIAVVRRDDSGRRSAWPLPMLPWQRDPGRITLDLTAWGEIRSSTP